MPTLDDILGNSAHVTLTFASGTLNVEYRPSFLSQETMAKLQILTSFTNDMQQEAALGKFREYDEMIVNLIASWDLLESDGVTVIPLTVERLLKLNFTIVVLVVRAILEDVGPNLAAAPSR
jgi:hypothetical protein